MKLSAFFAQELKSVWECSPLTSLANMDHQREFFVARDDAQIHKMIKEVLEEVLNTDPSILSTPTTVATTEATKPLPLALCCVWHPPTLKMLLDHGLACPADVSDNYTDLIDLWNKSLKHNFRKEPYTAALTERAQRLGESLSLLRNAGVDWSLPSKTHKDFLDQFICHTSQDYPEFLVERYIHHQLPVSSAASSAAQYARNPAVLSLLQKRILSDELTALGARNPLRKL